MHWCDWCVNNDKCDQQAELYQEADGLFVVLHFLNLQLTFASLNALKPRVIEVTSISALVKPGATASATTALAGFLDGTAPGTCRPARLYDGHQLA